MNWPSYHSRRIFLARVMRGASSPRHLQSLCMITGTGSKVLHSHVAGKLTSAREFTQTLEGVFLSASEVENTLKREAKETNKQQDKNLAGAAFKWMDANCRSLLHLAKTLGVLRFSAEGYVWDSVCLLRSPQVCLEGQRNKDGRSREQKQTCEASTTPGGLTQSASGGDEDHTKKN